MKKVLSILVAAILVMSMAVTAFAAEVVISADAWDADCGASPADTTFADGSFTSNDPIVCLNIPGEVALGETVTVTIKGTSVGDFRVWLLAGGQVTASEIWKASENGFTTGDFEYTFELTCFDKDSKGVTLADAIAFKGPSYGVNLDGLTVTSIVIDYPGEEAVEETPVVEETPAVEEPVEDTPVEETPVETKPADTGLALAVVPMIVAAAAVALSKKR